MVVGDPRSYDFYLVYQFIGYHHFIIMTKTKIKSAKNEIK